MSQARAMEFISDVRQDTPLRQKFSALNANATTEEVLDLAAAEGYNFSAEELQAATKEWMEKSGPAKNGELSDSELELVAGGAGTIIPDCFTFSFTRVTITIV